MISKLGVHGYLERIYGKISNIDTTIHIISSFLRAWSLDKQLRWYWGLLNALRYVYTCSLVLKVADIQDKYITIQTIVIVQTRLTFSVDCSYS